MILLCVHNFFFNRWPQEDLNTLYWYYIESRNSDDVIQSIIDKYMENEGRVKSKIEVVRQLYKQNLINRNLHDKLLASENSTSDSFLDNQWDVNSESQDIKILKEQLIKDNMGDSILWLQQILLDACYCRIVISNRELFKDSDNIVEPIPYCYSSKLLFLALLTKILIPIFCSVKSIDTFSTME